MLFPLLGKAKSMLSDCFAWPAVKAPISRTVEKSLVRSFLIISSPLKLSGLNKPLNPDASFSIVPSSALTLSVEDELYEKLYFWFFNCF